MALVDEGETQVWFSPDLLLGNATDMRLYPRGTQSRPEVGAIVRGERFKVSDLELTLADGFLKEGDEFARICPDFMVTADGAWVVSRKLHDVLMRFDMGRNHLVEVRFSDWERKQIRPERFWILSVVESKAGIDFEANSIGPSFEYTPEGAIKLDNVLKPSSYEENVLFYNDQMNDKNGGGLALKSSVRGGVDLWRDPSTKGHIVYLSNRLKCAIGEAGLNIRRATFFPARLT